MSDCKRVFDIYEEMLALHIGTKTTDIVFHKESLGFYEVLFSAFHDTKEGLQDSKQEPSIPGKEARAKAYKLLEEAKGILESMVESNKDMALDNTLRGLVDKLGFMCGSARALCPCNKSTTEEEPKEEDKEEPEEESKDDTKSDDDVSSYGMAIEVIDEDDDDEDDDDEDDKDEEKDDEEKDNKNLW